MMIMGTEVPMPESPQAKFWTWAAGIMTATSVVLLGLDATFMRKVAAEEMRTEFVAQVSTQTKQFAEVQLQIEYAADRNVLRSIDNELFKLEQLPDHRLLAQDRAVLSRLRRERQELIDLWNRRGRALR